MESNNDFNFELNNDVNFDVNMGSYISPEEMIENVFLSYQQVEECPMEDEMDIDEKCNYNLYNMDDDNDRSGFTFEMDDRREFPSFGISNESGSTEFRPLVNISHEAETYDDDVEMEYLDKNVEMEYMQRNNHFQNSDLMEPVYPLEPPMNVVENSTPMNLNSTSESETPWRVTINREEARICANHKCTSFCTYIQKSIPLRECSACKEPSLLVCGLCSLPVRYNQFSTHWKKVHRNEKVQCFAIDPQRLCSQEIANMFFEKSKKRCFRPDHLHREHRVIVRRNRH